MNSHLHLKNCVKSGIYRKYKEAPMLKNLQPSKLKESHVNVHAVEITIRKEMNMVSFMYNLVKIFITKSVGTSNTIYLDIFSKFCQTPRSKIKYNPLQTIFVDKVTFDRVAPSKYIQVKSYTAYLWKF